MPAPPEKPPLLASLLFFSTVALWSTWLLVGSTTLSTPVARSAGAAGWLGGMVVLVGLLVARGRWAQRAALGLLVAVAIPAGSLPSPLEFWVGVPLAAAAAVALLTDPARSWIRPGRSLESPPDAAVILMITLILWPLAGSGLAGESLGLLLWSGPLLAFWYGRATVPGLWAVRIGSIIPLTAAIGAGSRGWVTAAAIAGWTAWWSWQAETRLAVLPLIGRPSAGVCPTPDFDRLLRGADGHG